MQFMVKKDYKKYNDDGDVLLWSCKQGDILHIKQLWNKDCIKIVNHDKFNEAMFFDMFISIADYNNFKYEYLHY